MVKISLRRNRLEKGLPLESASIAEGEGHEKEWAFEGMTETAGGAEVKKDRKIEREKEKTEKITKKTDFEVRLVPPTRVTPNTITQSRLLTTTFLPKFFPEVVP